MSNSVLISRPGLVNLLMERAVEGKNYSGKQNLEYVRQIM